MGIGIAFAGMWAYLSRRPWLLVEGIPVERVRTAFHRSLVGPMCLAQALVVRDDALHAQVVAVVREKEIEIWDTAATKKLKSARPVSLRPSGQPSSPP